MCLCNRLKGSYSSLDGGQTTYALVDFTGGVTERIDLREKRWSGKDELFNLIRAVISKSSMLGCEISSQVRLIANAFDFKL